MEIVAAINRHRAVVAVAAIAALGAGIWFVFFRDTEPRYKGRKLSDWCADLCVSPKAKSDGAREAVLHIGTNAVPWLVRWISYEPPAWEIQLKKSLPDSMTRWIEARPNADAQADAAVIAFQVLGSNGCSGAYKLMHLAIRPDLPKNPGRALAALQGIGEAALPEILNGRAHDGNEQMAAIISFLGKMPFVQSQAGVRWLGSCVTNQDLIVATTSVHALESVAWQHPGGVPHVELVAPAFIAALNDPRPEVRLEVIESLMHIGSESSTAVQALKRALTDPDMEVRRAARSALTIIDGER